MTPQEIIEFIKQAKELGLKSVEVNGVKVEFNSQIDIKSSQEEVKDEELISPLSPYDTLSDEEILFWSSDYGQELEQEKIKEQERKQAIKDGDQFK